MPHLVHQRKFGRQTGHRKAMLRNLTLSVLRYESVKTTEAKAKEVRKFIDGMIVLGKDGSLVARRKAIGWLPDEEKAAPHAEAKPRRRLALPRRKTTAATSEGEPTKRTTKKTTAKKSTARAQSSKST